VPDGKQTVTFTQGGIQKAVRDGGFKILNNGLAGHAYSHQLRGRLGMIGVGFNFPTVAGCASVASWVSFNI